jgi:hypothetical protein
MIKKFLPLVGITVILALFIVWEAVQGTKYGYAVAKLQKNITDLRVANRKLGCEVSALKKPQRIVRTIQSMRLGLIHQLENRDRIAKAKQRLKPKKGKLTKTTVLASVRTKKGRTKRNKR